MSVDALAFPTTTLRKQTSWICAGWTMGMHTHLPEHAICTAQLAYWYLQGVRGQLRH